MRLRVWASLALAMVLFAAPGVRADVWDIQTDPDNSNSTDNDATHGLRQVHDLAALPGPVADQDWFGLNQKPFSSYEFIVEGVSGDLNINGSVQRVDALGAAIQAGSILENFQQSLRWENNSGATLTNQYIRVGPGQACGTTCGPDDQYTARFRETTLAIPRFNNAAGQVTVLILQNPAEYIVTGHFYLWNALGTLLNAPAGTAFTLGPKNALVQNLSGLAPGASGTITVSHDARYGDLTGKAVALEPPTGFSFDSIGVSRPD
jgi:hypothetical protein